MVEHDEQVDNHEKIEHYYFKILFFNIINIKQNGHTNPTIATANDHFNCFICLWTLSCSGDIEQ